MYYVKKRRVVEDAVVIPEAISRITTNPMVNFEIDASNRYEEILQQQQQLYEQQQQEEEDALLAVDPEVIPQRLYGRGEMIILSKPRDMLGSRKRSSTSTNTFVQLNHSSMRSN